MSLFALWPLRYGMVDQFIYSISNLCVSYGLSPGVKGELRNNSLSSLSLKIRAGSRTAILGYSGSGKSTLLSVLGTLRTKCSCELSGAIEFKSKNVVFENLITLSSEEADAYRKKSLGFVLPDSPLLPNLTCMHNLCLPLLNLGVDRHTAEKKVGDHIQQLDHAVVADRSHLRNHLSKYPTQLSSGQKQRFAVLRSIMHDPSVILADEPFSNLDPSNHLKMLKLLSSWQDDVSHQNGRPTVILVSHHWETALDWAEDVFLLHDGSLVNNCGFKSADLRQNPDYFRKLIAGT